MTRLLDVRPAGGKMRSVEFFLATFAIALGGGFDSLGEGMSRGIGLGRR
jgi:hypothetical protein